MNVFYTNTCPSVAASEHCVRHRNKMIIEYAQLLSTAHHVIDGDRAIQGIYKCTHTNHPSAVWVRQGRTQYQWVLACAKRLCELYRADRWVDHKTLHTLQILTSFPSGLRNTEWTDPPACVADHLKPLNKPVQELYRMYMIEKFNEWTTRDKPLAVQYFNQAPEWVQQSGVPYNVIL